MTARKRALCLLLLGLLLLTGCSGGESAAIEGVTGELVRVQSLEDGAVVYCLPEAQSLWPDAAPLHGAGRHAAPGARGDGAHRRLRAAGGRQRRRGHARLRRGMAGRRKRAGRLRLCGGGR